MRSIPDAALALVKTSEGFRATRNTDPTGNAEIGYGHKMIPGDPLWNASISEAAATSLAMDDLEHVAQEIAVVLGDPMVQSFTDGQWAALLDFTYNEGIGRFRSSTMCRLLQTGQLQPAGQEFNRWVYGTNPDTGVLVKLPGLVTRRAAETALWQG